MHPLSVRVSELEEAISGTTDEGRPAVAPDAAEKATGSNAIALDATLSPLDRKGVALGCFVLARCLQLGQAVARNERKALDYYNKAIIDTPASSLSERLEEVLLAAES